MTEAVVKTMGTLTSLESYGHFTTASKTATRVGILIASNLYDI